MHLVRKAVKEVVEPVLAASVGKLLWAPVSVAVLAHGENDDILVLESGSGHCLPGGLLKSGEDLKEAGQREVKEETGCDVEMGELLEISTDRGLVPGIHFFFEAEVTEADLEGSWEGEPKFVQKSEVQDIAWQLHHSHVHEYLFPED